MKTLAIIPARYASTRFPGKPLALLGNKPMIQWVYERVSGMVEFEAAIVATDDERIEEVVKSFGGRVMMTSSSHKSGTDRCGEVVKRLEQQGEDYDVIVNVQGDEPFVDVSQLKLIISCFNDKDVQIATLKKLLTDVDMLKSPNVVKVITDKNNKALYFSRNIIPYIRGVEMDKWMEFAKFYKHVGIYAYRKDVLKSLVLLEQGNLEKLESLEQLRWLENGYRIEVKETDVENVGIDTMEDLKYANELLLKKK